MIIRFLTAGLILAVSAQAQAETPNIQPGLWEHETRMTVDAPFPVPEQNDSSTECVTAEDIADAETFIADLDVEECEVTREELRADGANYEMTCHQDGITVDMVMDLKFHGDHSEGVITTRADTPMGPMNSKIVMTGRRIGECD